MKIKSVLFVWIVFLFSINLFAGNILRIKTVDKNSGETTIETIYVQNGQIRFGSNETPDGEITIINPKARTILSISPLDSTYRLLTKKDFAKFAEMIKMQKEKLLNQLPEEERQAMESMINAQLNEMKNQPKMEYKKIDEENFNGYNCEVLEGTIKNVKTETVWLATWQNMDVRAEYRDLFHEMKSFIVEISKNFGGLGDAIENELDIEIFDKGFPVKTVNYEDGNITSTAILESVQEQNLSSELFDVPDGFTQKDPFEELNIN